MLGTSFLYWLLSILLVTQHFNLSRGIPVERWTQQYKDHFNYYDDETWWMRYYENDEFYRQSGPIFIMIGGETPIKPVAVEETSYMYQLAEVHGAMMYNIEHRYYGKSHPVPDTSLENLKYLSVPQALADIALFIEMKKKQLNSFNAFVMVFGSSYAGNLAAWMRVEYPNLVHGALADSAPIYVTADFFEYYELAENSIRQYDERCAISIKETFSVFEALLKSPEIDPIALKSDFKLCHLPVLSQPSEISRMINVLANIIVETLIDKKIQMNGKTSIENFCIFMRENEAIHPYYRLAQLFKNKYLKNHSCIKLSYNHSLEKFLQASWESEKVAGRLWRYQCCTELGYYQTSSSPESMFGSLIPLQYFVNRCKDLFTGVFTLDNLNHKIWRINHWYNSKLSNTTNIIFTNGEIDPWRVLSVISDLNADSPAILIHGAAHRTLLIQDESTQTISHSVTKCRISLMIYEWIYKYTNLANDFINL